MRKHIHSFLVVVLLSAVFFACKKDSEQIKTTGKVSGTITDADNNSPLSNVRIIIFDANTNAPVGITLTTSSDGKYSTDLTPGNYYLKLYRQGYENIPAREVSAIPFSIVIDGQQEHSYKMLPSGISNAGFISGKVLAGTTPIAGALIVASNGTNGYSSVTDKEGKYVIYNVPAASYTVKGWLADYNSSEMTASVSGNTESSAIDLSLTKGASGGVSGQISFLATNNIEIDVALTHPATKETIPGLSVMTSGGTYTITNVPDGKYLARATYSNDTKVMDPDWIIKNGEPFVTVSGASVIRNFSVTGTIEVSTPSNPSTTTEPVVVTGATPTFTWAPYSSTDDYVIEVMNANGKVIWGGFSDNYTVKNIIIPKSQTSVAFNADGKATEALQAGNIYRWRIYASKSDIKELSGWKLISVSEDQRGLITIKP